MPSLRADTSGNGNFSSPGQLFRVTRGYLDTRTPNIAVGLSGQGSKVTFYGRVERRNSDREYTMNITSSDRGPAENAAGAMIGKAATFGAANRSSQPSCECRYLRWGSTSVDTARADLQPHRRT